MLFFLLLHFLYLIKPMLPKIMKLVNNSLGGKLSLHREVVCNNLHK